MKTSTVLEGNQQTKRSLPHKNNLHSDCSKNSFVNKVIGNWAKEINSKNPVKIIIEHGLELSMKETLIVLVTKGKIN